MILAALDVLLDEIYKLHDGQCPVSVRGDANSSSKNALLKDFLPKQNLQRVHIGHPTYHHFLGGGQFDSDLDILLHSEMQKCKHERLLQP